MEKTIELNEADRVFRQLFEDVVRTHEPFVVTRGSEPTVVMIPYYQYVAFQSEEDSRDRFHRIWAEIGEKNAHFSEEEVEADLEQATKELRERRAK